ncbi:tripartite ATP-independent transporter DctM subunit [Aminivibrio pyruvatiphilus]|uniref:Tripartite ATP-independent transporter DctM subunit n=1 Tax=Aminivibrio pyruvatiphilus TaxID=1005740 RepID=A0A4R8M707_9BACT|nr:TRAP transporter large permease [Aminivibrio pyruvatiphilus]TDY61189.1 tripartite ATP-independent transporter DctM subunit [Aminivibrio pyruvatiphilus]
MTAFLIIGSFVLLITLGVPIAFVIGIISLAGISTIPFIPNLTVFMKMFNGLNSFVLLAIPLFILAANIMNHGKITEMLVKFCIALTGSVRGGLAHANILVSMIFAGVSGSSQADTAGVGKMLIPAMIKTGYDKENSVGVTAASSTIGVIIPPSIPMVVYSGLTNASVAALFIGGMVPGILVGLVMMLIVHILGERKNFPRYEKAAPGEVGRLFRESFPALLTPLIIVGGITTGWYTPTEAAAFASVYAMLISLFYYKTLRIREMPGIIKETLKLSSLSLFALATASALGELLGYYKASEHVAGFFAAHVGSPEMFMLIVIAFFLFVGTFMDAIPAMILFMPVILPYALKLGISSVHLGVVVVMTLALGLVTPPYGLCLLIASSIADLSIEKSFIGVLPYISALMIIILVVAMFPNVAFFLPKMLGLM